MPRIFEHFTNVIPPGSGTQVNWGPDFGDPSDDSSFEARVGAPVIDTLAIDSTIIAICELILAMNITGTFDLTAEGQARIENLLFAYTGPWTATGAVAGDLNPDFNLLTAAGLVERDISTIYDVLISQGVVILDDVDLNYTGPWTALGTIAGDLSLEFTGPWTTIGTIDGILSPTYANLTSQSSIVVDTLELDHTKTCNCAARVGAVGIEFTGPHTCQGLVDELLFELDFVNAATGVNIDITVPTGATSMFSEVWSGGGGGGTAGVSGGGGGGGGGYASDTEPVTAGTTITIQVGAGGAVGSAGGLSIVQEAGTTRARATGGGAGGNGGATQGAAGTAGDATNGDTLRDGGAGGGGGGAQTNGGGGGGGSGTANAGGAGAANRTAGIGGAQLGGNGGIGGGLNAASAAGSQRGGGGGGASATNAASAGARGGVRVRFDILTP